MTFEEETREEIARLKSEVEELRGLLEGLTASLRVVTQQIPQPFIKTTPHDEEDQPSPHQSVRTEAAASDGNGRE